MKLAAPSLCQSEFPPEAEKPGKMKGVGSVKSLGVYDEVPTAHGSQEQIDNAFDGRRAKVWKTDSELTCRFVVCGSFHDTEKMDDDALLASTPSC